MHSRGCGCAAGVAPSLAQPPLALLVPHADRAALAAQPTSCVGLKVTVRRKAARRSFAPKLLAASDNSTQQVGGVKGHLCRSNVERDFGSRAVDSPLYE